MSISQELITEKKYTFTDDSTAKLQVTIKEKCDPAYGMFTWPCAPLLSQFIFNQRQLFQGKRVLELGSGTGLCGIVAALIGGKVHLTDCHSTRNKSNLIEMNVALNGLTIGCNEDGSKSVQIASLTWGRFSKDFFLLNDFDIIIASDCFYDPEDFEDILVTISFLLRKNPLAVFYTAYQVRNSNWNIECLLRKWKLKCEAIQRIGDEDDDIGEDEENAKANCTIIIYKIAENSIE